ncbi:MAG: copper chaperone PCu(A)C [Acetobacteraceae bacterium]
MFSRRQAALLAAGFLCFAAPTAVYAQQATITVEQPWTRAAQQGGVGGVFMTLHNTASQPDKLVSVSSPICRTTEIHTTIKEGDVMRMRPVDAIDVPPGGMTELRPGGMHVMLIGLSKPLTQGSMVPLTLTFEHSAPVTVQVPVEAAGAPRPSGQGHGQHR